MKTARIILVMALIPCFVLGASAKRHPRYNWTGFYIGGNLGYGVVYGNTSFNPLPDAATFMNLTPTLLSPTPSDGFMAGGQMGFNLQTGSWISGVEADLQKGPAAGVTQTPIITNNEATYPGAGYLSTKESVDWLATFRLRTGFSPFYRLFIYLTGGAAYGSVNYSGETNFQPDGVYDYSVAYTKPKLGWTAGAGAEWVTDWNWSVKIEDLFYDLGDETAVAEAGPSPNPPYEVGYHWITQANWVRVGVNFKFF